MASTAEDMETSEVAILLLKTKSTPGDGYQDIFSKPAHGFSYVPSFVPVLEHKLDDCGMARVGSILQSNDIGTHPTALYGGLIFTSQRAVEAFTKLVHDGQAGDQKWPHLQDIPVYSVGPATTRALKAVPQDPPLQIFGEHTGNGEMLAHFVLQHYGEWYTDRDTKPTLLFLVGEQRRDIIPKTLTSDELPQDQRIQVDEIVVYGTGVMESFPDDFKLCLESAKPATMTWIVVFSPTGCDAMLAGLGMLNASTGKAKPKDPTRTRFVATIGPTTRDYLKATFDFEPDVCADRPSPEGLSEGINQFIMKQSML